MISGKFSPMSCRTTWKKLTACVALGWRWFSWLCTILCGILFVAIFFGVPETRFHRILIMPEVQESKPQNHGSQRDDEILKTAVAEPVESEHLEQSTSATFAGSPRKPYVQQLKLWSGVPKENFWAICMRPVFMIAYPAVIWSTISCKTARYFTLSRGLIDFQTRSAWLVLSRQTPSMPSSSSHLPITSAQRSVD